MARETRRLLLLDGDAEGRAALAACLENAGWRVAAAGSTARGLALLKAGDFAGAVVDVGLEDGSGLEALSRMRRVKPGLRVIVTAGSNTRALEKAVREEGVAYYYVKGFDRGELLQAVADAFGGRRMNKPAKKILIVDDDPDYQAAVKNILESAGYEVIQAQSKEEGLEALKMGRPDLVILDIMMTRTTDGFHFLYEMKAQKAAKPPILSVSCISEATGFEFTPTGDNDYFPADDFLAKPVAPADLLSHVEALLEGKAAAP